MDIIQRTELRAMENEFWSGGLGPNQGNHKCAQMDFTADTDQGLKKVFLFEWECL